MPSITPFDKSYDPNANIDLSLFAHIHNDASITGAFELEGSQFKRTLNYLNRYFAHLAAEQSLPVAAVVLQKRMSKLVEIEAGMGRIRTSRSLALLKSFSESIADDLLVNLKKDEYFSLPGGWLSPGGGHAMVYQFKRIDNGLEFYIHNAGAGISYHERQSAHDRELYYPVQAYHIPLPVDKEKLAGFLCDLMKPQLQELRAKNDLNFDAKRLYEEVLPRINFLDARLLPVAEKVPHAYTAGQLSGTCAERCLHQMLKANFHSLLEYQQFIYRFKRYALNDFMTELTDKKGLHDKRAQVLVNDAINTMLRMLNIPALSILGEEYIQTERAALLKHRDALERAPKKEGVKPRAVVAKTVPVGTFQVNRPRVLTSSASQPSPASPVDMSPVKSIVGGPGLLEQLKEFLRDCERLKSKGQYPPMIERLESLFANLPLPSANELFDHPIAFYHAINRNNQAEFYELIGSLNALYLDACKGLIAEAVVPRMLVVGLSVASVNDYVAHQVSLNNKAGYSFHSITTAALVRFFEGNRCNPYFATNNPTLDARLQSIKLLYTNYSYESLTKYYQAIVNTEPTLKRALEASYIPPEDPNLAALLQSFGHTALYWLTERFAEFEKNATFKPLIEKFNIQFVLERCAHKSLLVFRDYGSENIQNIKLSANYFADGLSEDSLGSSFIWGHNNGRLLKHKYRLPDTLPSRSALTVDTVHDVYRDSNKRSDNHIQLFPSEVAHVRLEHMDAEKRHSFAHRLIDRCEVANREFFQLRSSPAHQIKLTLDYFLRHLAKLSDSANQIYMEANLFEPGLLIAELDKNPDILNQIDLFIEAGLKHYAEGGLTSQPSLFFIRLAYLVNQYAVEHKPAVANGRLGALQQKLTILLQVNADNDVAIKQTLHQYQFLTAMARLKLKPNEVERKALLELAIPAYFYMKANNNPNIRMDTASQFDLKCVQYDFKRFVAQSDQAHVGLLVGHALENLNLGVCSDTPKKEGSFYSVNMKQGNTRTVYRVDVDRGLVFNTTGMAYAPVPLDILHHPVMKFLNPAKLEPCFTSSDGNVFEMGQSELRFIRADAESKYRVQKKWTVGGVSQWYELHDLSDAQDKAFNLNSSTIGLPFPGILKQRDTQVWVGCDAPERLLIVENHQPSYQCKASASREWMAKQLDEAGYENGFSLCLHVTWFHELFSKFEDAAFITVCQREGMYQIKFGRYGLTLLATQEAGKWVFRLQNNPSYTLVEDANTLVTGDAGLVFEDKITHLRECYLPLQPFICAGGPSPHSEFHAFKQDIAAAIPKSVVTELTKSSKGTLLPWQYTGCERVIRYSMDKAGQPCAETASDALYLCYVYLGSQQPKKAWAILEDCEKRLGGLKGTVEELSRLNWIMNALPRKMDGKDNEATISTPAYVACQIKALALLTSAFTPDKVLVFPPQTFDLKSPEGLYQDSCWKDLQAFHKGLNGTIYTCYARLQNMQRYLMHDFHVTDAERKSLLDYYHFNLLGDEPKALGALGYEWQVLQLKTLRQEYEALKAEERAKGRLPTAYQKRMDEIGRFLQQDALIRAHHTDLELLPIDLSIPLDMCIDLDAVKGNGSAIRRIWGDIDRASTDERAVQDAMKALTPDITEEELIQHFPCYYKLVKESASSDRQKNLLHFCHQYLRAHRHVPLRMQESKTTYLCNILYRIAENRQAFGKPRSVDCLALIKRAQKLPDPVIKIYQACHTTHTALAEAGKTMMWDALKDAVPAPSIPMEAAPCKQLANFSVEKLIDGCDLKQEPKKRLTDFWLAYRDQASIFGAAPDAVAAVAAGKVERVVLSSAEREAGKVQGRALQTMKRIASDLLANQPVRKALQDKAQDFIGQLATAQQEQLAFVLRLANTGPANPEEKRRRDLDLEGGVRAPLDIQRLLALYFRADRAQYALATGLSDIQIEQLHTGLSHYLGLSVRQQTLQRFCDDLMKNGDQTTDPSALQQIAHGLFTEDLVDASADPVLMLIQYNDNLLLRPQQIAAIKRLLAYPGSDRYTFSESIEKIIMGGGKSKVMLPVLAQSKATGSNLVVVEVPPALFETNCVDLSQTSERLFNQKAVPFQFNRDSDCSSKNLHYLYSRLMDVMVHKDYLVTTGEAVQSLELKYLELLLQRPDNAEKRKEWNDQCEWLDKIVSLFRTRADVVIDEVHQGLLLKKKLNYTLGDKRSIPTSIINECVELYDFFEHVSLTEILGETFAGKTLASLLENNQLITQDPSWQAVMAHLTKELVYHPASPLQHIFRRAAHIVTEEDKRSLVNYLANKGTDIPACVRRSDKKTQNIFALYKEQVSQLIPQTLKRQLNVNYGASQLNITSALAIPYVANNVPSERSRFGNYLESINFTIQMLLIGGFRPALLKQYLQQLQVQARQELLKDPDKKTIDNTPTGSGFRDWAPGFEWSLSQIRWDDEQQFAKVFQALHKNKKLICDALKSNVLTKIHVESEILHSDAYNHVDIYRSCQGITGTPWNSSTFHQRLTFDKSTAAATDGFILNVLEEKRTTIRRVSTASLDDFFNGLFAGKKASESLRAIIDICASFKGISNIDVARRLAIYVKTHPAEFSSPSPIKYILFFNEANLLCALDMTAGSKPVIIGSTDPDVINAKLGCTPDQRFSYYDQAHTIGVDLKQARCAKALVLVDHETHLQSFLQGCMRMRGLQDEQSVELIVPENYEVSSLKILVSQMATNEEKQLLQDNFSAAQAKMTNLIRADFMSRLLDLNGDDVDKKHQFALAFKAYFVELASQDFFAQYGGLMTDHSAKDILMAQHKHLMDDWTTVLKGLGAEGLDAAKDKLSKGLDQIIKDALPICQKKYLSPTRQEQGREVEVQKQVLVELHREAQLEREQFDPSLDPYPYKPWIGYPEGDYLKEGGVLSLTDICSRGFDKPAPDFGEIYASSNYYQAYENQTKFIGPYIKPVHAILFRQRTPDGKLDCLILSQKEAVEFTASLAKKPASNMWLSTTQHTVLAGRPPVGIKDNVAYQAMIEKIRFFNGELRLLIDGDMPLNWLSEQTAQKMEFFNRLSPYRETDIQDEVGLSQALSQRQKAYRYIAEHPLDDYTAFEWRTAISEELTDADIEECRSLAQAFANANQHWQDKVFSKQKCQEGLRLTLQASSYVSLYFDGSLQRLRDAFPLYKEENVEGIKADVNSILPSLLKDYIPNAQAIQQTPLQFLLKKASLEPDSLGLMRIAEWLVTKKVDVNAVDADGYSALERVVQADGSHTLKTAQWLFEKGAQCLIHEDTWRKIRPETLWQFFQSPIFRENESFLLASVDVFRDDEAKLQEIITLCPDVPTVLQKIIEQMKQPAEVLLQELLLNERQYAGSVALVKQLLQKLVDRETGPRAISDLSSISKMQSDVLTLIIAESKGVVNRLLPLFNTHFSSLRACHLMAMLRVLPKPLNQEVVELLQSIVKHVRVEPAELEEVVGYTLNVAPQLLGGFWKDLSARRWDTLNSNLLGKLFLTLSDQGIEDYFDSPSFLANRDSVISSLLASANPVLYHKLLLSKEVKFEPRNLLLMLTSLDAVRVQDILPQLVNHSSVDEAVLQKMIEVMDAPSNEFLQELIALDQFATNTRLAKQLLDKLPEKQRQWLLSAWSSDPGIEPVMLKLLIDESLSYVDGLIEIIHQHPNDLSHEHLKAMLASNPHKIAAWQGKEAEISILLQAILAHAHADASVITAVLHCALTAAQLGSDFWKNLSKKMTHLDLSGHELGSKSSTQLAEILKSISSNVTSLDLSDTKIGNKDSLQLAEIFAAIPASVKRLDVSGNKFDSLLMAKILELIPDVEEIAYDQHKFMSRAALKALVTTNYSFLLKCFASIAMVSGAAMVAVGMFYLQPVLVGVGLGLIAAASVSACLLACGLFAPKDPNKPIKPDMVPSPQPVSAA